MLEFILVVGAAQQCSIVQIDYEALVHGDVSAQVAQAFGRDGHGILAVTTVPERVTELRRDLLGLSRRLAMLPPETLAQYERPDLNYVVGWSRGREKFRGQPDVHKGSWYANGLHSTPASGTIARKYPTSTAEPDWPNEELGANFSGVFRDLSRHLYNMSQMVLGHYDQRLADVTHRSRLHVGRLLHYYPGSAEWCGWHNDNSMITALVPPLYFDDSTGVEVEAPPGAGLIVRTRTEERSIVADDDHILFQVGEAAQVMSGGKLVATPHAVVAGTTDGVSRESFALFVEPNWDEPLQPPPGYELGDVLDLEYGDLIPPLRRRLPNVPVDFAQFLADSVREYY